MRAIPAIRALGLFTALAALSAPSAAQLAEMRSTQDGRGTLEFRSRSSANDVQRVSVNLLRSGRAEIVIVRGAQESFRGTWSPDGPRGVRIRIDEVGRDDADGTGSVTLDGRGSFTRVDLSGSVGRNARFSLRFSAGNDWGGGSGGGGGQWNTVRSLDRSERGSGNLRWQSRSTSSGFDRIRVRLNTNHEFEIDPSAGISDGVRGRWWQTGPTTIELDVSQVGRDSATGKGKVELDGRGSFRQVGLNAFVKNASMTVSFLTDRFVEGGGGSGNQSDSGLSSSEERRWIREARGAVEDDFSRSTRFDWDDETVGQVVFGNRTVTGRFEARGGNRPGRYRYTVVMGAGTMNVKSKSVSRD